MQRLNIRPALIKLRPMVGRAAVYGYLMVGILFGAKLAIVHLPLPMDFGSFMASGELAEASENPYSYEHQLVFMVPITAFHTLTPSPNLNPPISLLPFQALSWSKVDLITAAVIWKITSFALYLGFVYTLMLTYPESATRLKVLWALSLAGFWQTVEVGQIYMPLLIIVFLAWRHLEKGNPLSAGFFVGLLIAIKPQFALWAIALLLIGQKKVFLASAVTSVTLSAIPAAIYGPDIYRQWVQATLQYTGVLLPGNMSIQSVFARLGIPVAGLIISAAMALLMLTYLRIKRPDVKRTTLLSILTTLSVSPYSWSGYSLFLLPALFERQKWSWRMKASAGLLAFPIAFVLEYFAPTFIGFISIGWVYGWALLLFMWDVLGKQYKTDTAAPQTIS